MRFTVAFSLLVLGLFVFLYDHYHSNGLIILPFFEYIPGFRSQEDQGNLSAAFLLVWGGIIGFPLVRAAVSDAMARSGDDED